LRGIWAALHPCVNFLHPNLLGCEFVAARAIEMNGLREPAILINSMSKAMSALNTTMQRQWTLARTAAVGAMLCAACVAFPRGAAAQAGPGPIHPAPPSGDSSAGTSRPEVPAEMAIPDKKQLFASWKFNLDESDDAQEKMKEARGTGVDNPANPHGGGGNGTGIHMGGMGSPYPGGGGGGGNGGGNGNGYPRNGGSKSGDADYDRQELQELMNPAGSITLVMKDTPDAKNGEVLLTDDAGRQRAFYTDGRKVQKSKDDKFEEFDAHWEDYRLVAELSGSHGPQITRSFEPAPGGKQLVEMVRLDRTRSNAAVEIRFVYDLVAEGKPAEKKP
jgi:hypothetical protein